MRGQATLASATQVENRPCPPTCSCDNGVMTRFWAYSSCLVVLATACSSSEEGDLFEANGASGGVTGPSSNTAAASTGEPVTAASSSSDGTTQSATSGSDSSTTGGVVTSAAVTTATSAGSLTTASASGAGGTTTSTETASATTTSATTASATTGSSEPTVVTLEYEDDEDCVELTCPEEAPYLVACDITFSTFDDQYACLALEPERVVFVKSGDSCQGSVINQGSTLTCSSEPLAEEITGDECVTNKDDLDVVADRCDCEAASEIDSCP